jgi:uncharacterized protein (UPF0216 family)
MLFNNESAMERWLKFEYGNINKNLVTNQKILAELLKMDDPVALTKDDETYQFDSDALMNFSREVPKIYHKRLKLPIIFYKDMRVKDSCFMVDELAVKVLKHTNNLDSMYRFQDGRLWVSKPIAHDIAKEYPTLIQFIVY